METEGRVAVLRLTRPEKRNALDTATILAVERFFSAPPDGVGAVVLAAEGPHFCAGLDLSDLTETSTWESVRHSLMWHRVFDRIEAGPLPVVAALHGAVIGGGLELAASAHIRVAEESTFYALPEGQRGLFVGGGGSVRLPRLIGASRMTDMMLTGRVLDAAEGQAAGLSHYLVGPGDGLAKAVALAEKIAQNAPVSNFAVLSALPRIAEAAPEQGYLLESLMSAVAAGSEDAQARMRAFLEGKAGKVTR
ncbi:crotonase/enoyl-CoA hydratase family protein [Actinocorallia sp. A-T 12471]|uniref:crotonase/enoyl-CoA hydratase family protein n=1 Tax=Actinocorallia sp. A-T 12471 TaxID=3089813 RepID=UPI0029CB26C3|nr:crotonase/enoyl-CoA hydratase family protein [Actinocorallia sp. A-T 12471]MDX6744213.1 crotonase/enoyl-CoA hydratase family protein [Actinocorallia sp. A-T 12471]